MAADAASVASATVSVRKEVEVISLVAVAHAISHFAQLLLPPLFPFIKAEFNVSYAELALLLTIFFVCSGFGQTAAGFVVDRVGARAVLLGGLALTALAAFGFAFATHYWMLAVCAAVAGAGNCVFHPADYTLLNRKVSTPRLGHAYSVHGLTGSLGWALAGAMLVPLALAFSWRVAMTSAAVLIAVVFCIGWVFRDRLELPAAHAHGAAPGAGGGAGAKGGALASQFGFLAIPAVWMCFLFFLFNAIVLSGVQSFATEAARLLHEVPLELAAQCLTIYMITNAVGMGVGGFLISDPARAERIIMGAFGVAALFALSLGFAPLPAAVVPVAFACMGIAAGIASPSRDMLVKRSAPDNASGRVFGVVYSGLDAGMALGPLVYGGLLDAHQPALVWLAVAIFQGLLIFTALNVRKVRRVAHV